MVSKRKFKAVISPTAYQDIDEAIIYYSKYSKKAARLFYECTLKTIESIQKNPYYEKRFDEYRVLKIYKFPFIIVFRIDEKKKVVYIITVFNTYRNPDKIQLK